MIQATWTRKGSNPKQKRKRTRSSPYRLLLFHRHLPPPPASFPLWTHSLCSDKGISLSFPPSPVSLTLFPSSHPPIPPCRRHHNHICNACACVYIYIIARAFRDALSSSRRPLPHPPPPPPHLHLNPFLSNPPSPLFPSQRSFSSSLPLRGGVAASVLAAAMDSSDSSYLSRPRAYGNHLMAYFLVSLIQKSD